MQLRREFVKVYLTTPQHRALADMAYSENRSMSTLVITLIEEAMAAREKAKP
jgi:hypothetical protein